MLATIGKALDLIEIVYSALKIAVMFWSGAKLSLLKGKTLPDITLYDLSETLMQTMLDKIVGKEIPEGDIPTDERPEAVYPTEGNSSEEGAEQQAAIEAEFQNLIRLYGEYTGMKAVTVSGSKGLGTGSTDGGSDNGTTKFGQSNDEDKEIEKEVKAGGITVGSGEKALDDGDKTEVTVLEEKGEKVEAKRVKITNTLYGVSFEGDSRVIGNKKIKLNKTSVTHGDDVKFSFIFTAYFKGELCEFQIRSISAKVHIDKPNKDKPQQINLIVTEPVTCYFKGGKLCIKKGKSINYTQIDKK